MGYSLGDMIVAMLFSPVAFIIAALAAIGLVIFIVIDARRHKKGRPRDRRK